MANFLEDVIDLNDLRGASYYEPFAGGAGAALALLERGAVSQLFLNDLDPRIYAFWRAALNQTNSLVDRVFNTPLTLEEWEKQRSICRTPSKYSQIDVGFAAFYMNRCNRSGVLTGAGPIGGFKQKGKWRMDARFNRDGLAARLHSIGKNRDRISMTRLDANDFLKQQLPTGRGRKKCFAYLDPPYVEKGQRLYLNAYGPDDHGKLASYICRQTLLPWIMSYDNSGLVRTLYREQTLQTLSINYTLQNRRSASELIISPDHVMTPNYCRVGSGSRTLENVMRRIDA